MTARMSHRLNLSKELYQSRQRGQEKIFLWTSVAEFCAVESEERRGGVGRTGVVERREDSWRFLKLVKLNQL